MGFLWELMAFLLMLTPLVFIHELGHFLFAKLFNVKVKTFSIFMGKKLFKRKWGETEYCISLIPIGGYVSLVGEDPSVKLPPEEEKRALYAQTPFKKFLVIAAGPVFNIILTVILFAFILRIGEPVASNKIARIVPFSDAYYAGLKANDRITAINSKTIKNQRELIEVLKDLKNQKIELEYQRDNVKKTTSIKTDTTESFTEEGKIATIGYIKGAEFNYLNTIIGISSPESIASQIGLKTGDKIISVADKDVNAWYDVKQIFKALKEKDSLREVNLTIERNGSKIPFQFKLDKKITNFEKDLGFEQVELYVNSLKEGYPAEASGILKNDRLYSIANKKVYSFLDFKDLVQKHSEESQQVPVTIIRKGELKTFNLKPKETKEKNILGDTTTQFYIGIGSYQAYGQATTDYEKTYGFINILKKSVKKTYDLTLMMFNLFGKLLTGNASPKQLAGPLMISKIASDILSLGTIFFLKLMAMISLNLAIVNFFPFPALDGGHILIIAIEAVTRRKIPAKAVAIVSYAGFVFLITLMIAITFNDIVRRFF